MWQTYKQNGPSLTLIHHTVHIQIIPKIYLIISNYNKNKYSCLECDILNILKYDHYYYCRVITLKGLIMFDDEKGLSHSFEHCSVSTLCYCSAVVKLVFFITIRRHAANWYKTFSCSTHKCQHTHNDNTFIRYDVYTLVCVLACQHSLICSKQSLAEVGVNVISSAGIWS